MPTLLNLTPDQKKKAANQNKKLDLLMTMYHKLSYNQVLDICKIVGLVKMKPPVSVNDGVTAEHEAIKEIFVLSPLHTPSKKAKAKKQKVKA